MDSTFVDHLREAYEAETARARRFRYGLLVFDATTILFIVVTSFLPRTPVVEAIDILIGLVILADIMARFTISRQRWSVSGGAKIPHGSSRSRPAAAAE